MSEFKILKGIKPSDVTPTSKWTELAKEMEVGDCIDLEGLTQTHGLLIAFRNIGFRGMQRKQLNGKTRVWKCALK